MEFGKRRSEQGERRLSADQYYMRLALEEARLGESEGEVPVGAVLVHGAEVLARAHNCPIGRKDPTAHAEILVLREAAAKVSNYRLPGSTIYVTMEPCAMCAGALVNARVQRLVFACRDLRFGAVRSKFGLADSDLLNHRLEIEEGVCAVEAADLIRTFFAGRRSEAE